MARPSDDELMVALQAGDGEAFQELYARYATHVLIYFRRRRVTEAAEDLLQEVWIRVLKHRASYRPGRGLFRAWLYTISRHLLVDHCREKKLRLVELSEEHVPSTPVQSPDLSDLTDLERSVVTQHFLEGRTFQEIADTLGRKDTAVRQISHRAIARLRRLFQGGSS